MKNYILALICLSWLNCPGQISNVYGTGGKILKEQADLEFQGSQFLKPDWVTGSITDSNGKKFADVRINYDCKNDFLIVLEKENKIILEALLYPSFSIEEYGASLNFKNGFKFGRYNRNNYFQVFHEGNLTLLKRYETKLIEETVPGYGTNKVVEKLQQDEIYYLLKPSGDYVELKKNRSNLFDFLEDDGRLKDFAKKQKLNLKDDADLMILLTEAEEKIQ